MPDVKPYTKREPFSSDGFGRTATTVSVAVERIVPGQVQEALFREHEARYIFAGRLVKDKQVLDVACGTGIGTQYLLKAGARACIGLDIDSGAIEYAKATYSQCSFAQCDATTLCLPDASVDVVVSFETIEHVRDQDKFLLECERVLRPSGVLVCSTPNRTIIRWEGGNPYHVHELTTVEFGGLLETMFVGVQLYAQKNVRWFPYVTRKLISRSIGKLGLKAAVKKMLGWKSAPLVLKTEFDATSCDVDNEIQPYQRSRLTQPMYVIAAGYKKISSDRTGEVPSTS